MDKFKVVSPYEPSGDQGSAIEQITKGFSEGEEKLILKGVTGSGKTFTMAKIIEKLQRPALIISHNKTLAAQLYREFTEFFPENRVEYFVSYYDYYQPEAYVPSKDLYIEKDASINDEIERLRLSATRSLMERRDTILVATVSCIYGLGNPESYNDMRLFIEAGQEYNVNKLLAGLVSLHYTRNNLAPERGSFRMKGDVLEIFPAYMEEAYRIRFEFETAEQIVRFNPLTGHILEHIGLCTIFPAKHFVLPADEIPPALERIKIELKERLAEFESQNKLLEMQRLQSRTEYDLEMLDTMGYCSGIENYTRQLHNRLPGEPPYVLINYFPDEFLTFIDESHVTVPQIGAMYEGDRSRKSNLVEFGFRLPSAMDNRPLTFLEFDKLTGQTLYVTATPGKYEMAQGFPIVEQVVRPTGLLDPKITVLPTEGQIDHLLTEIRKRIAVGERILITTLTKRMAEDLSAYLVDAQIKTTYLHSEIGTMDRVKILHELRAGIFDVLVGINLLREGLDIPEVSLIAIMDADKIGFLRSTTSLIQIIGRASRNVNGQVLMFADVMSSAMTEAIEETNRRRKIQEDYNTKHGITPETIKKKLHALIEKESEVKKDAGKITVDMLKKNTNLLNKKQKEKLIKALEAEMIELAKNMEYEEAAVLRDEIIKLKEARK